MWLRVKNNIKRIANCFKKNPNQLILNLGMSANQKKSIQLETLLQMYAIENVSVEGAEWEKYYGKMSYKVKNMVCRNISRQWY